ncbi:SLBB domain-containing protein [Pontiellaceae bacterium B12219]|nr:SLBB domain-containing protein [Pontiellaceae bacterium B12219]
MMHKFIFSIVVMFSVVLCGCVVQPVGSAGSDGAVNAGTPMADENFTGGYTIKALDPLYIRFSGIMEQQVLEVVVDENGEINLLHIEEPIKAAGLSTSQLEHQIERLYIDGGIYKNVSVNVTMTAKVFYVQGEVNAPGQFQLMSGTTLLQAIAGARGPTAFANLKKVTIARHGKVYTYDIKKLERDPSLDVKINAGDVIKVWQTWY